MNTARAWYSREALVRQWGLVDESAGIELPTIAACVRIRNEARYLREWVEFHRLVGVRYFYVFDDDSVDSTREILKSYVSAGEAYVWGVSNTPCPGDGREVCADRTNDALHGELGFRDECLRANPAGADWILMTDVDEFLYPSAGSSVPVHLSLNCDPRLAYALVRWHVFGASGHTLRPEGLTIEAYRERGREDDRGCYPRLTCGDDKAPPICAKVLARANCVKRQGTHYVVQVSGDCIDIYVGEGKAAKVDASSSFAAAQHEQCVKPLHLNHYAVRSREDFVEKFERGRISSEARDVQNGFAEASQSGVVTRQLPNEVVVAFLEAEASDVARSTRHKKASTAQSRAELMLVEFARRDHSNVLDESVLRFASPLRRALGLRGTPPVSLHATLTWACASCAANSSRWNAAMLEAAGTWRQTAAKADAFEQQRASKNRRSHQLAVFLHIPKTAGTTLNLILGAAARTERLKFCQLSFADLDRPRRRSAAAQSCDLMSAETDISILPSLQQPRVALFAFLREPITRVVSQYEHHLSSGRLSSHQSPADILRVVSPQLCQQLERDADCYSLRHPRKCRAGGWCSIFQNHQTHVIAGAQHLSTDAASAIRRSSLNLLCAATNVLQALPAVGLTEHLHLSLCLLFDKLGYSAVFDDCCVRKPGGKARPSCGLFDLRATKHSAADRAQHAGRKETSHAEMTNNVSYVAQYLDDDLLVAAIYEGNALDCALYAQSVSPRICFPISTALCAAGSCCRTSQSPEAVSRPRFPACS